MARSANAGELRTRIRVTAMEPVTDSLGRPVTDEESNPVRREVEVYACWCKWVNAWGSEVYAAMSAGVTEPATLTLRYTGKITAASLIYKGADPRPYEVISVNDVEDRHAWLEVKVRRRAVGL